MLELIFTVAVLIYLQIIAIRVTVVGFYNMFNFTENPLEEVAYKNEIRVAVAFFEVLAIHFKIWHPRKILEKTVSLVKT